MTNCGAWLLIGPFQRLSRSSSQRSLRDLQTQEMNRNQKIELRVTKLEKKLLEKRASESGLSVSEYLRRAGFGQKIGYKLTPEELDIYKDLHQFHRNFTALSNFFKVNHPELYKESQSLIDEIKGHLKKLE